MKISIFGTGYVGLVAGAIFADVGHEVLCIDVDEQKIKNLEKGIIPIYEPGLSEVVLKNFKNGNLKFSLDAKLGVDFGDVIISAVGTPEKKDGTADLKYVFRVAETFAENLNSYKVFVNKSTVPVGTGEKCKELIQKTLNKRKNKTEFSVASNPEFLREGTALKDFLEPERIILGCDDEKSLKILRKLYKKFVSKKKIIEMDVKSAEVTKYAANSFLAMKVSFINEIANFCSLVGADVTNIKNGIGVDSRIGKKFLNAGIGYGGSCFPKDVRALIETGKEIDYDFGILNAVLQENLKQKELPFNFLKKYFGKDLEEKTITILGTAFKPETDDDRESPALILIEKLLKNGIQKINLYDPKALENTKKRFEGKENIFYFADKLSAIKESNAIVLVTEWKEFEELKPEEIGKIVSEKVFFDGRNVFDKNEFLEEGFIYQSVGR